MGSRLGVGVPALAGSIFHNDFASVTKASMRDRLVVAPKPLRFHCGRVCRCNVLRYFLSIWIWLRPLASGLLGQGPMLRNPQDHVETRYLLVSGEYWVMEAATQRR